MADLGHADVAVVDGEGTEGRQTCELGIESTVCKVDCAAGRVLIYRRGAITQAALERALSEIGLERLSLVMAQKIVGASNDHQEPASPAAVLAGAAATGGDVGEEAPGQLLTHYAPDVDTFLVRPQPYSESGSGRSDSRDAQGSFGGGELGPLAGTVVIGFGDSMDWLKS